MENKHGVSMREGPKGSVDMRTFIATLTIFAPKRKARAKKKDRVSYVR